MSYGQDLKQIFLRCTIFLFPIFVLVSCGDNQPQESHLSTMESGPTEADLTKENDTRFLVEAVEINFQQILIAKLAQRRAAGEEVKALGQLLEEANRTLKSELTSLAYSKSISVVPAVPPPSAQAAYDTLNTTTIEDFDLAYLQNVISGYMDAIQLCEATVHANIDPDIKSWAQARLPDYRLHLLKAKEIETHLNPISMLIR